MTEKTNCVETRTRRKRLLTTTTTSLTLYPSNNKWHYLCNDINGFRWRNRDENIERSHSALHNRQRQQLITIMSIQINNLTLQTTSERASDKKKSQHIERINCHIANKQPVRVSLTNGRESRWRTKAEMKLTSTHAPSATKSAVNTVFSSSFSAVVLHKIHSIAGLRYTALWAQTKKHNNAENF